MMKAITEELSEQSPVDPIIDEASLAICCGPGGVGKTTTSAALGLRAALAGRRVAVLTIDPAKRLADSLGLEKLDNEPRPVDLDEFSEDTSELGKLEAMMLDEEETFNDLIHEYVPDAKTLERSKDNKIFKLLTSAFHGVERFMALEKLHDLYTSGDYDLVVLDTPPTKNALEFLETPKRATQFFDKRVLKWLLPEDSRSSGFFSRLFSAGSMVQNLLAKLLGEHFVDELVEFFGTFQYLRQAIKERGEMIDFILRDRDTSFVVVTSPEPRRIKEALYFDKQLENFEQSTDAFIINRVTPHFNEADLDQIEDSVVVEVLENAGVEREKIETLKAQFVKQYRALVRLAERDRKSINSLADQVVSKSLQTVPILNRDIHNLNALKQLGQFL